MLAISCRYETTSPIKIEKKNFYLKYIFKKSQRLIEAGIIPVSRQQRSEGELTATLESLLQRYLAPTPSSSHTGYQVLLPI